jgi:hypothetical protein
MPKKETFKPQPVNLHFKKNFFNFSYYFLIQDREIKGSELIISDYGLI